MNNVFDPILIAAAPEAEPAPPPAFSDDQLADRVATKHISNLRYVAVWGKYFHWNGKCWKQDNTLYAYNLVRKVCRQAAAECNEKYRKQIASAKTVAAVTTLMRTDPRIAATVSQWDADPWLLNTPDGVVDLRTGKLRAAVPEDYMTKITAVGPGGGCPQWKAFLNRVMDGDAEKQNFLQRFAGYSLTGSIREHALAFAYGTGANGKGRFVHAQAGILGDYHKTAPIETFTATQYERHPTDLAGLRGARLVTATETEEGRRWAEAKIKTLTGGDPISARFMRQDYFEYDPQFKLLISGNHKPGLRSIDEAIRRRFNLVPFTVTIPANERDHDLDEKLQKEWPGILQWMIEGCLEWQAKRLSPPDVITKATDEYLAAQDVIGSWIAECCIRQPEAWTAFGVLYNRYVQWAKENNEWLMPAKAFAVKLEGKGFAAVERDDKGRMGLALKRADEDGRML